MPVIGYLSSFPADINPKFTQAFQQGLNEADFFEGRNVAIEYRWDEEGRYDRLPMMAADLVVDEGQSWASDIIGVLSGVGLYSVLIFLVTFLCLYVPA